MISLQVRNNPGSIDKWHSDVFLLDNNKEFLVYNGEGASVKEKIMVRFLNTLL